MIEEITSPLTGKRGSWVEGSLLQTQHSMTVLPVDQTRSHSDRALIVYQNVRRPSPDSTEVAELLAKARIVLPAIMNYLYFGSTQVAVVYFGKRVNRRGVKSGIRDGAQDLKIRLVRYLTAEMWPPLLRTDAPDESLGMDASMRMGESGLVAAPNKREGAGRDASAAKVSDQQKEVEQERAWFLRSIENQMQVLLYLKNSTDGKSKYLKVVLQNPMHRLYFDVCEAKEEKYRWDLRMLFTRMMDNLETQKAIDSYEAYLEFFRQACAMAAKNALFLERPRQPMLEVVLWTKPKPPLRPSPSPSLISLPPNLLAAQNCEENHDGTVHSCDTVSPLRLPSTLVEGEGADTAKAAPKDDHADDDANAHVAVTQVLQRRCSVGESAQWLVHNVRVDEDSDASSRRCTPTPARSPALASTTRSPTPFVSNASLLSPTTLGARHSYATRAKGYQWMSNLQKPESATLDYKSYFFNTALEIRHRCVKFMCGFLNAYGEGKLVVGVHEIPRNSPVNAEERKEEGTRIVLHNDLVDQFVVGARVCGAELECLQVDVSEQLLCCIPPIPPRAMQVDAVPVRFPPNFTYASRILILYDFVNPLVSARDALKQKSNYAIRFLFTLGLSIVPLDVPVDEARAMLQETHTQSKFSDPPPAGVDWANVNAEAYLIASVDDPAALTKSTWEEKLANSLNRHKQRCFHAIMDYAPALNKSLELPELFVLEVSVDIKRCGYAPLAKYKGKFFAGWPSIPVWDPTTRTVRAVERNYCVLASQPAAQGQSAWQRLQQSARLTHGSALPLSSPGAASPLSSAAPGRAGGGATALTNTTTTTATASSPARGGGGSIYSAECCRTGSVTAITGARAAHANFQQQLLREGWAWFAQPGIMGRVLAFLYSPQSIRDVLQFRLIHPLTNLCFETRQGNYLVQMIYSTPVGVPIFNSPSEQISRIQYSFLHANVPPLPLLLCHCYETIGNLPSPYPFVAVPLVQQTFRVAPCLVPLFFRQHYFDGQMRLAVVLDLRDSLLKTVELRNGNLLLDTVVGVGFEPMNKRQLMRHFLRRQQTDASTDGLARAGSFRGLTGPETSITADDVEDDVLLKESFLARRAFKPQALTYGTESHMGSLMMSPGSVEVLHASTEREVEADIPLLHFSFLSRKAVEKGGYLKPEELPRSWRRALAEDADRASVRGASSPGGHRDSNGNRSCTPTPAGAASTGNSRSRSTPSGTEEKDIGSGSEAGSAENGDAAAMGAPVAHGRPWTLQHLLYWYNAFLTDREHYSVFGCGHRSIAFRVASLSEVCEACVEVGAVDAVHASALSREGATCNFAKSRDVCVLHRKVHDWLAI